MSVDKPSSLATAADSRSSGSRSAAAKPDETALKAAAALYDGIREETLPTACGSI